MTNEIRQKQSKALSWIVSLLNQHQIPFLICGGLAAIGYGSNRKLNDIDLFVTSNHFNKVVSLGNEYINKPAQRYCETTEGWDLEYVQFVNHDIKIEIGNPAGAKIFDSSRHVWTPLKLDFSRVEYKTILGIEIPLMDQRALIDYKKKLRRPVDLQDIEAMTQPSLQK
ncbi:MAG: nucleotidyltransferase [Candidatus Thiodiazotropha sp. (ex. Lucinisca nassula)]|nr:nucleotidyltransferase [Candidatus Thiodiazotropha sp. (ex. Lucinisca nassula)]